MYSLDFGDVTARFTPTGPGLADRDYQFSIEIENVANFQIHIELVRAAVWISGHCPTVPCTWAVSSHVLAAHKSVGVSLPDVLGLTQRDIYSGAQCTGLFRCQRVGSDKFYRCEFDLTVMPDVPKRDGWPKNWAIALNREIDYGVLV